MISNLNGSGSPKKSGFYRFGFGSTPWLQGAQPEMGIYRDNLSAIVIGDNLLPIIVIARNGLDLSISLL